VFAVVRRCSAAGGSHNATWWRRSAHAESESVWSGSAATDAAAADIVWTPDANAVTTHGICRAAGGARRRCDAIGSRHSTTDTPVSRNDTASCHHSSRPGTTISAGVSFSTVRCNSEMQYAYQKTDALVNLC